MKRVFVLSLILLFLFTIVVYADTYYTIYDTGLKTYVNKNLYVGYEQWVLDYLSQNAPEYNNSDYYWLIFMTANNGNTGLGTCAWFLEKSTCSGKPFTIDIGNNNAPTSTTRNVTLNKVAPNVKTYWFDRNGTISSNLETNYNAYTTYCKWESTSSYVCYLVWSDNESSNFNLGGVAQTNVFPVTNTFTDPNFDNYDNTSVWGNSLVTGEFYNFVINCGDSDEVEITFMDNTYVNARWRRCSILENYFNF